MTKEMLKAMSEKDVLNFIRERLSLTHITNMWHLRNVSVDDFKKEHLRFEMSGYESNTGECTLHNQMIVNKFADLGIYDYTHYLVLDFYKGSGTIYLKYWYDKEIIEDDVNAFTTSEIIYRIFELTIFTNRDDRKRI